MFRHWISGCAIVLTLAAPRASIAQPAGHAEDSSLLSAFVSWTDLRVRGVRQALELLAATDEVRSGRWDSMQDLVRAWQGLDGGLAAWYVRPDGEYYTAEQGLMDVKLSDREYFPDLVAGKTIVGALVVSRSTGERSAVIAVPVRDGGRVVGAIGASLFLDRLAVEVDSSLALPPDRTFFALAPNGLTTLHRKTERHFLDPRELGSESLKRATNDMLAARSGEVRYEFDRAIKRAAYRRSGVTQWTFAISSNAPRN